MATFGKFKLTDALPEQSASVEETPVRGAGPLVPGAAKGKGKRRGQAGGARGKSATGGLAGEQEREARENSQAKNAEGSIRDRMVDIGRGNQQAGRQRAK
jgi:hypothetical protein